MELSSEQETAEILADPAAMTAITEGLAELAWLSVDPVFVAAPVLLRGPLEQWRQSIADVPDLQGGDRWRVTITGYRDGSADKVLHYQIEAVPEMDPEAVKETMALIESRLGPAIEPGDKNYPVRPQK